MLLPRVRASSVVRILNNGPYQTSKRPLSVAFFGTDEVSLASLRKLQESSRGSGPNAGLVSALDVVCPGDRPSGRGQKLTPVPVAAFAREHAIREINVPYGLKSLKNWDLAPLRDGSTLPPPHTHDLAVVVSFGYFMPSHVLDAMRLGAVNVHPSLLPRYRGAAPIEHTLLNGDAETGVSIIELHRGKFDAGAVLDQVRTPVEPHEGCRALTARLAELGAQRLMHVLANYERCRANATQQSEQGATKAPKLRPSDGLIRWDDPTACTAECLMRRFRAFDNSFGVYSHITFGKPEGVPKRVRLLELSPLSEPAAPAYKSGSTAGSLVYDKKAGLLALRASDGWLAVGRLHVEARSPLSVKEFANGYKIGTDSGHRFTVVASPAPP